MNKKMNACIALLVLIFTGLAFVEGSPADDGHSQKVSQSGDPGGTAKSMPIGVPSADGTKVYRGRVISVDFQDTDIDNVLRVIAEVSQLNIIADDDVRRKVSVRLIDVPWDQVLDIILKANGLGYIVEGNVVRVATLEKLREEREALYQARIEAENLEDLTVLTVKPSHARAEELAKHLKPVLSRRGTITADKRTNQLIITDIQKGHQRCIELMKLLDRPGE